MIYYDPRHVDYTRITSNSGNWSVTATNDITGSASVRPEDRGYTLNLSSIPENPDEKKTTSEIQRERLLETLSLFNRERIDHHAVRSHLATRGNLRAIVRPEFHARSNPRGKYGGQVKKAGGLCRRKEV